MRMYRGWLGILAGLSFGAAWGGFEAVVDIREEPPAVFSLYPWVGCGERVPGGLSVAVCDAPDLLFVFEGLPEVVELGYVVHREGEEVPLGGGVGTFVPLASWPQASRVTFYALSGDPDWAAVRLIAAAAQGMEGTGEVITGRLGGARVKRGRGDGVALRSVGVCSAVEAGGFAVYEPCTETLTVIEALDAEGESGETETRTEQVSSLAGIVMSGNWPSTKHAISAVVSGIIRVEAGERFRVGADDSGSLSVGGETSEIGGEHALKWGNWATVKESGYVMASASFASVGGPYAFQIEGLGGGSFWRRTGSIPYAQLVVSPAMVEVPWTSGVLTGAVTYGPRDERVAYTEPSGGNPFVSVGTGSYTVNPEAFWLSGAKAAEVKFSASQRYDGETVRDVAVLSVRPAPTSLTFDPGVLAVNHAGGDSVMGRGEHEPLLRYELLAPESGVVAVSGLEAMAGPAVEAVREDCLRNHLSTNITWSVSVPWKAYYGAVEVASGEAPLTVVLDVESKVKACVCDCAEGTQTDNACVSFRQAFGRTPLIAGLPVGRLAIEESSLSDELFTPAVLRYDHPMMRRLDLAAYCVVDAMGKRVIYNREGCPASLSMTEDSRLEKLPDGTFRERFADRSAVDYARLWPR